MQVPKTTLEKPTPKPSVQLPAKPSTKEQSKKSKKSKKKFARHKIRSESPDKEFYDVIDDPAETQVATSSLEPHQSHQNPRQLSFDDEPEVGQAVTFTQDNDEVEYYDDLNGEVAVDDPAPRKGEYVASKENPLDRRALLFLEKQLQMEEPESEFDLHVSPTAFCTTTYYW